MARGRKPRVRVSDEQIDKARKKIKSTPKRGRWPKYDEIHPCDLDDYIECFKSPSIVFLHPKYKNACFERISQNENIDRKNRKNDKQFNNDDLYDKPKRIGTIRFFCESWDPDGSAGLYDLTCLNICERVSCPYYKKGFITETLKNRTFEDDINDELNKRHNIKQEID